MSLIIKADINDIFKIMTSKSFIGKVFCCSKSDIKRGEEDVMYFDTTFTSSDLHAIEGIQLPAFFGNRFEGYTVSLITTHSVIKQTNDCFIIKYVSVLKETDILYKLIANTKIVLYISVYINPLDNTLVTLHIHKKLISNNGTDDDTLILNTSANDIMNNIYQYDKIEINENIVNVTETLFGKDIVHNSIIPFINLLYNTLFDVIMNQYKIQFIKYFTKKHIEVYKKK